MWQKRSNLSVLMHNQASQKLVPRSQRKPHVFRLLFILSCQVGTGAHHQQSGNQVFN
uniref:Uncharacterized protein n=1 Tax=Anguilla anguilla TaxID=7936 RepID=A0A0E9TIU3_ANGAN